MRTTTARFPRIVRGAAAMMLALVPAPAAHAQDTAGYVFSVQGAWFTSARPADRVSAGRVVRQGEEVWAAPRSSAGAFFNVVLRDGNRLALTCTYPGDCNRRHIVQVRTGLGDDVSRIVNAVFGLLQREPRGFSSLIARADGPDPADLVVVGNAAGIDVSAAFAELGRGHYTAMLERRAPEGFAQMAYVRHTAPAAPRRTALLESPGRSWRLGPEPPGLYVLHVEGGGGSYGESWVLVAPPREHARISAEFARAKEIVSKWKGVDAAHDGRVFLRAYLASLAGAVPLTAGPR